MGNFSPNFRYLKIEIEFEERKIIFGLLITRFTEKNSVNTDYILLRVYVAVNETRTRDLMS